MKKRSWKSILRMEMRASKMMSAGLAFARTYWFLGRSERWSSKQLETYQLAQLRKIVKHSYENVPYYRETWVRAGFHPDDLRSLEDVKSIPFTTRQVFQDNLESLKARNYHPGQIAYVTTGGSTGIPLGLFEQKHVAKAREAAFICRLWKRAGYRPGDKRVVLRGKVLADADQGIFWKYSDFGRALYLSSYHMNDDNLQHYVGKIDEYRAPFLHAYPSAVTILADYMRRNSIGPFRFLKAILAGSENLYPWQRQLLEDVFRCRVYSWYGHVEKAVLAGECELSHDYHIFPEYGYTELIDKNGNNVTEDGAAGEIVATGFGNYVTPFIRYRTMDMGVFANAKCECGRNYPVLEKLDGRLQEMIVTGDDKLISMTSINMHTPVFDNLRQFQFLQERKGEITLNIIPRSTYSEDDARQIHRELSLKLGPAMRLNIKVVNDIPPTRTGKHRFLIQEMAVKYND